MLPGTFGLEGDVGEDIRSFSTALEGSGVASMIIEYFDATGTAPGIEATKNANSLARNHGSVWTKAISDGITTVVSDSKIDQGRVGVLGFSLGGNFGLRTAMSPPPGVVVGRVADFFGPITSVSLPGEVSKLPKIQIHHGEEDEIVKKQESETLVERLKRAGKVEGTDFDVFWYSPCDKNARPLCHGFKGQNLTDSRTRAVDFFQGL